MAQSFFGNRHTKIGHDVDVAVQNGEKTADIETEERVDFGALLLSEAVLKGLYDSGFKRPSPIQLKSIPTARCGVDLVIQAKSGTGKTCVFAVVALETVITSSSGCQVVILAPTREIACQIFETLKSVGRHIEGLKCACFIGGKIQKEDKALAKEAHIVVGSPGRICQLVQDGDLSVDSVRLFVLDEADKLMDDSYQENINWIFSKLPSGKQVLVFSATYPRHLDEFLKKYMRNPQVIKLDATDVQLLGVKQFIINVKVAVGDDWMGKRIEHLHNLLSRITFSQCLVFCNYQDKVELIYQKLKEKEWPVEFIGAHVSQHQRLNVIRRLKNFSCRVLVSTDLTARGIDAEHVNLVINFDIPYNCETYLHRIGRAGRFGGFGASLTLLCGWQAELNFYHMAGAQELRFKTLPDDFPLDILCNAAYFDSLPYGVVPSLVEYERKAIAKAAKRCNKSVAGCMTNYSKIMRLAAKQPQRFDCSRPATLKHFNFETVLSEDELQHRSAAKYSRQEMFAALKTILGVTEPETATTQNGEGDGGRRLPHYKLTNEKQDLKKKRTHVLLDAQVPVVNGVDPDVQTKEIAAPTTATGQQIVEDTEPTSNAHRENHVKTENVDQVVVVVNHAAALTTEPKVDTETAAVAESESITAVAASETNTSSIVKSDVQIIDSSSTMPPLPTDSIAPVPGILLARTGTELIEKVAKELTTLNAQSESAVESTVVVEQREDDEVQNTPAQVTEFSRPATSVCDSKEAAPVRDVYVRYFDAFDKSFDDLMCQVYGGFAWHRGLVERRPVTAVASASQTNRVQYDREQMLALFRLAAELAYPSDDGQRLSAQMSRDLGIFEDVLGRQRRLYDEDQHQPAAICDGAQFEDDVEEIPFDDEDAEEQELEEYDDEEEEEECTEVEECPCAEQYAQVLDLYERALKRSVHSHSNVWSAYLAQVKQYRRMIRDHCA